MKHFVLITNAYKDKDFKLANKIIDYICKKGGTAKSLISNVEATDITGQAEQSMKNVGAILEAAGASYDKVVKTTCFLADIADFAASICREAGYGSVGSQMELFAKLSIIALSIPELTYLIQVMEQFL